MCQNQQKKSTSPKGAAYLFNWRQFRFTHVELRVFLIPNCTCVFLNINWLFAICADGGDTPGFTTSFGERNDPWAFPGAEKFQTENAHPSDSQGDFPKPDEWLSNLKTDVLLAFFGYSESFEGEAGLTNFKAELSAFVEHTLAQKYNGATPPQLALVSPIAFQNLSDKYDLPNGINENKNLELYTNAIQEVAKKYDVLFLDAFNPSKKWFETGEQLTIDGCQLNTEGIKICNFIG